MSTSASVQGPAPRTAEGRRSTRRSDPLRSLWRLLTNVKFALLLVVLSILTGVAGTILPQLPAGMASNPAARALWMEQRREDFGALTDVLAALGAFELFRTPWFTVLWATLILSATVCTVSRLRPTWRNVVRPPKTVPDAFFERARHRQSFAHGGNLEAIEEGLRARRYRVERTRREGSATYLFADRFPWAQYGTFLTHLALLILLLGALFTFLGGTSKRMVLPEVLAAVPVFDKAGPGQLFVRVLDAYRGLDEKGNIVAFHTDIEVRRGDQLVTCRVTVNGPCSAFGYRVHQAAYFDDFARIHVNAANGKTLFDDVVDFGGQTTIVPWVRVTGPGGEVVQDEGVPQIATDPGTAETPRDDLALGAIALPDGTAGEGAGALTLAWRAGKRFRLLMATEEGLVPLEPGDSVSAGPYLVEFRGPVRIPAVEMPDFPKALGPATFQMVRRHDGSTYLLVAGLQPEPVLLTRNTPYRLGDGSEILFGGRLEGAGLDIRRDPGDTFIWIGIAMALAGLSVTFYVPRRRLWVRVEPGRVTLAAAAERGAGPDRALRHLAAALSRTDPGRR